MTPSPLSATPVWIEESEHAADTHAAFRAVFHVPADQVVTIRHLGASWYRAWLDGEEVFEGPARFCPGFPEYQEKSLRMGSGRRVLAVHATFRGLPHHRMDAAMTPFLWFDFVGEDGEPIEAMWRGIRLDGATGRKPWRRVNDLVGWAERVDTRLRPVDWNQRVFDDSKWPQAVEAPAPAGSPVLAKLGEIRQLVHAPKLMAHGTFSESYGHPGDDLDWRFFSRDLDPVLHPATGRWWRFDLGKVRLFRPRVALDLPEGAVVEMAYGEFLVHGRVSPYILGGNAMNLDHYIARGGTQVFEPLEPRGGRYLEIHASVPHDLDAAVLRDARIIERTYWDEGCDGAVQIGEPLLERIWSLGVESLRSCTEDAVTDNPTRERGQWTGDSVNVGLEMGACLYHDLRPFRRALVQTAQSAREDGMVAAMSAGFAHYIASFAAQWTRACLRWHQLTGDESVLRELAPFALRNAEFFRSKLSEAGIDEKMGWNFVDWGYKQPEGPSDLALNLFVSDSMRALAEWGARIGDKSLVDAGKAIGAKLDALLGEWPGLREGDFARIGYQNVVLGLRFGWIAPEHRARATESLVRHWDACYPLNPTAQPHYTPGADEPWTVTPYFAHFAFDELAKAGRLRDALRIIEQAWGWMLRNGLTTCAEVFDLRWSHCHHWSGAPTWVLSRNLLGLWPMQHEAPGLFELRLRAAGRCMAKGVLPLHGVEGEAAIEWRREGAGVAWTIRATKTITLRLPDGSTKAIGAGVDFAARLAEGDFEA